MAAASESNAREEALRRLIRIEEEGAYIGLDGADPDLDPREARQSVEYVAGVTRWRRRLDFVLDHYYRGDLEAIEPNLRQVLRLGLYDVLYLETPDYAAVNEAVQLAKRRIRKGAGGLVNGVLRSILRDIDALPSPETGDLAEDLAVQHSHPTWMVRRWMDRYGRDGTEELLEWNNRRPVYGVRANTLKVSFEEFSAALDEVGVEWEKGRYLPYFARVESVQPLVRERLLQDGRCAIQDESAGLLVELLDPRPHDLVVDLCSAPGGKALYAAQRMKDQGRLVAVDVHEGRLGLVERAAHQHGATIVECRVDDARRVNGTLEAAVDKVLVDAPCSGTGVLSKRADLRWKRQPGDLAELTVLQDEILEAASRLVKPGGTLVYGTCTLEPEENEERVEAFLSRHEEFEQVDASTHVPPELVGRDGYYRTFPPRDSIDGAFGARMKRV